MNDFDSISRIVDEYHDSYNDIDVHKLMLEDQVRTLAYKNAIMNSTEKFKNKVVMDVGAGTGILAIFCVKAGASKVYAVEASKFASNIRNVILENKCQNKIEVIEKKLEDIEPSSIDNVDIIVSEWMGFYLVHEGMLETVIKARDRFLKQGGLIFPNTANLYIAACQLPMFYDFWDDVYGVSMRCLGQEYRSLKSSKPQILNLKHSDLLTKKKIIAHIDLNSVTCDDISKLGGEEYVLVCNKDGNYQGICTWFTVGFPDGSEIDTAPCKEVTHWKQTILLVPQPLEVVKDEPISFKLDIEKDMKICTRYNFHLTILDASEVEHDIPCYCNFTKCIITRTYLDTINSK